MLCYFVRTTDGRLWHLAISPRAVRLVDPIRVGYVQPAVSTSVNGFPMKSGYLYRQSAPISCPDATLTKLSDYALSVSQRRRARMQEVKACEDAEKILRLLDATVDVLALALPMMRIGSVALKLVAKFGPSLIKAAAEALIQPEVREVQVLTTLLKEPLLESLWDKAEMLVPRDYAFLVDLSKGIKKFTDPMGKTTDLIQAYTAWSKSSPPIPMPEDRILDNIHRFRYVADPAYKITTDKFLNGQEKYRGLRQAALHRGDLKHFDMLQMQEKLLLKAPDPASFEVPAHPGPMLTPSRGTATYSRRY